MSSITIRNLDPAIKERLRIRAAQHGHSMEAEARRILQSTLKEPARPPTRNLYERIRARFEPLRGVDDLELPPRLPDRDPPRFDWCPVRLMFILDTNILSAIMSARPSPEVAAWDRRPAGRCTVHHHDLSGGDPRRRRRHAGRPPPRCS